MIKAGNWIRDRRVSTSEMFTTNKNLATINSIKEVHK